MNVKRYSHFICFLLVLALSSCVSDIQNNGVGQITDLSIASIVYYGQNNRWPSSIDELKLFCSGNEGLCRSLDWDKCASPNFKTEQDGSLKIEFYFSADPNEVRSGQKPNACVTLQKPNIQENVTK